MASFAKIGLNSKVIEVLSIVNEVLHDANGVEQEVIGIDFLTKLTGYPLWVQTSYNNNFRKQYAGIDFTYDVSKDIFIRPQPYPSWTLDSDNEWISPVPYPEDENRYIWNEESLNWQVYNDN